MAGQKKAGGIAWTDETWNPIRGCRKLSAGCKNCYAASLSKINPGVLGTWGANGQRVISAPGWESQFYAWEKKAAKTGKPIKVFVNSMWDPGEGADLDGVELRTGPRPDYLPVLHQLVAIARRCPNLRLQMLTKRPWNLVIWWNEAGLGEWPANLWIGVSVEDQDQVVRIDDMMRLPAPVRFLSVEPMLGPVVLPLVHLPSSLLVPLPSKRWARERNGWLGNGISWVIAGCESGHGARPMDLAWIQALRDQCVAAEVPLFFKQAMEGRELVSLPALDGRVWDQFPVEARQAGLFGAAR